jgi:hypothetical protein
MLFASNILIAGSNPNANVNETVKFPTSAIPVLQRLQMLNLFLFREFRVQYLNPPYFSLPRPTLSGVPAKIVFNSKFTVRVTFPAHVAAFSVVKGILIFPVSDLWQY